MSTPQEKEMSRRATELGNSGDPAAVAELIQLAKSPAFHVCRLAISALGKLAGVANPNEVIPLLLWCLKNSSAQVRQYTMKALMAYGANAQPALNDLCDITNNATEKDYNTQQALKSIAVIEKAVEIRNHQLERKCRQCGVNVSAGEYARSQKAFQRSFCDYCFDEVYLKRRNWDTKVELNKNIQVNDGTLVQSKGEKDIAEWLSANNIKYRYDERIRIIEGYAVRPDFYLPEFDLYIEYWGMDTLDYKIGMLKKQKVYQMTEKRVISLYPADRKCLDQIIREKLSKYIRLSQRTKTELS